MPRGRRQFTLQWLMVLVAVCGFEAYSYTASAKQKAALNLAVSITDNIYLYIFGRIFFLGDGLGGVQPPPSGNFGCYPSRRSSVGKRRD